MKRCPAPRRDQPLGLKRWGLEGCARLEAALRAFYRTHNSMGAASMALGLGEGAIARIFSNGMVITPQIADALAAKLGTTADAIASGEWKAPTKAA